MYSGDFDSNEHISLAELQSSYTRDLDDKMNLKREKFELMKQNKRLVCEFDEISSQYKKLSQEKDAACKRVKHLQKKIEDINEFYKQQIRLLKMQQRDEKEKRKVGSGRNKENKMSHENCKDYKRQQENQMESLFSQNTKMKQILQFIFTNGNLQDRESSPFWERVIQMKNQLMQFNTDYPFSMLERASDLIDQNQCLGNHSKSLSTSKIADKISSLGQRLHQMQESPYILKGNQKKTVESLESIFSLIEEQLSLMSPKNL